MSKIDTLSALNYIANIKVNDTFRVKDNMGAKKMIPVIKQALTDYTKQTEMLVELREKYGNSTGNYAKLWISDVIKDINTILEGGKV
jgi:peroxiredoxin